MQAIILMECDECRKKFEPAGGGICSRCRRLLCSRHLHGWFQGWRALKAAEPRCVRCREQSPG